MKAIKAGTVVITATTADGAKTASCTITVKLPQTGQAIDFTLLTTIGIVLSAAGFLTIFSLRKRYNF